MSEPEPTPSAPHMTPEQFRRHGHEVVDWIADYWESVESLPVRSQVKPGEVAAAVPAHPPERGEPVGPCWPTWTGWCCRD